MATKMMLLGLSLVVLVGTALSLWPDRAVGSVPVSGASVKDTLERMENNMAQAIMGKSPGQYFAETMIPYCRAGRELSNKMLVLTSDEGLAKLAGDMDAAENSFLEDMHNWQAAGRTSSMQLGDSSRQSFIRLMLEVKATTWQEMEPLTNTDPERSFLTILIAHSQGAIDMAKVLLIFESDDEIRRLASRIITEKQAGIRSMQNWLMRH